MQKNRVFFLDIFRYLQLLEGKNCGIRKLATSSIPIERVEEHSRVRRVIGGTESVKGAWPWHVALYFKGEQRCAGAVLTPDWIVTTAHCFGKL